MWLVAMTRSVTTVPVPVERAKWNVPVLVWIPKPIPTTVVLVEQSVPPEPSATMEPVPAQAMNRCVAMPVSIYNPTTTTVGVVVPCVGKVWDSVSRVRVAPLHKPAKIIRSVVVAPNNV